MSSIPGSGIVVRIKSKPCYLWGKHRNKCAVWEVDEKNSSFFQKAQPSTAIIFIISTIEVSLYFSHSETDIQTSMASVNLVTWHQRGFSPLTSKQKMTEKKSKVGSDLVLVVSVSVSSASASVSLSVLAIFLFPLKNAQLNNRYAKESFGTTLEMTQTSLSLTHTHQYALTHAHTHSLDIGIRVGVRVSVRQARMPSLENVFSMPMG